MKKITSILTATIMCCTFAGCSSSENDRNGIAKETVLTTSFETSVSNETTETTTVASSTKITTAGTTVHIPEAQKESPDKFTYYLKDYVGRNCSAIGYTSLSGERMEKYGDGVIKFNFIATDGSYIDVEDEELLKKYVVTGQSVKPNTEIKLTYSTSEGWEWMVERQNIEDIDLYISSIEN